MDPKKPWQSKQNWLALIVSIVSFIPGGPEFVAAHPQASMLAGAVVAIILRAVTKQPLSLD